MYYHMSKSKVTELLPAILIATSNRDSRIQQDPVEIGTKTIMEGYENKEQLEKKTFGIDAEYDALDELCQDIKERMQEVSSQKKAGSMRQMAMETVKQTKKRKSTGGDEESQPPRR